MSQTTWQTLTPTGWNYSLHPQGIHKISSLILRLSLLSLLQSTTTRKKKSTFRPQYEQGVRGVPSGREPDKQVFLKLPAKRARRTILVPCKLISQCLYLRILFILVYIYLYSCIFNPYLPRSYSPFKGTAEVPNLRHAVE